MSLKEKIKIIPRRRIIDNRGWFLKAIDGQEDYIPTYTGEVYVTVANAGQSKGAHYHNKAKEWFTLLHGTCEVKLKDIVSGESLNLILSENEASTLFVPPGIAHVFVNITANNFTLLAYTDQLYDPNDTIPFTDFA